MKTESFFCDICGQKFAEKEHWDRVPASMEFKLGCPPRQQYECWSMPHVCHQCIDAVQFAISEAIQARKGVRKTP